MLMLLTWASFTIVAPTIAESAMPVVGVFQAIQQDTLGRKKPDTSLRGRISQERPSFQQSIPSNFPVGPESDQRQFAVIVDSLIRINPGLKASLLRELLIPSEPPMSYPPASDLGSFNQQLARDSRISSFERMGLIARRYELTNPNARAFSSHQIDIIGTIIWLTEILK